MSPLFKGFACRLAKFFTFLALFLLCANQVLHFQWISILSGSQIVEPPFISLQSSPNISSSQSNNWNPVEVSYGYSAPTPQWSRGRLDSRRMVRIYEWMWTGSQWDELTTRFKVCLATQASVDRLVSIAEVSERWLGPVSLAVYIRIPDEWIALNLFVMYLQRCSSAFTQTVSIHVAVPVNYEPSNNDSLRLANFPLWSTHPCGQPIEFLGVVMRDIVTSRIDPGLLYPQNHMRNVARKTCGGPWVLMTDVDMIPRQNSAELLQEFYDNPASNCTKCQFVVPTFELSRLAKYPQSKQELIEYVQKGLARQYHVMTYIKGQLATNYSLWTESNIEEGPIKISHSVNSSQLDYEYEPFYIGSDLIPAHDERFIGYGFDRRSQVLEAQIMGWTFKVLTPVFVTHWGFAHPKGTSLARKAQNSKNKVIYNEFVKELEQRKNIGTTTVTGIAGGKLLEH